MRAFQPLHAAIALTVSGLAPSAGASPTPDTPQASLVEHCYTEALDEEEIDAGITSSVVCYAPGVEPQGLGAAQAVLARHYTGAFGTGSTLSVTGSSCSGASISFGSGDSWNNAIRSTQNVSCGNSKHFVNADQTGDGQLVSGGALTNMNATLAGRVSSVGYGA